MDGGAWWAAVHGVAEGRAQKDLRERDFLLIANLKITTLDYFSGTSVLLQPMSVL